MRYTVTQTLETERLLLRKSIIEDADEYDDHPEGQRDYLKQIIEEYDKPDFYYWSIIEKTSNKTVGYIRTINDDEKMRSCEMAYEIKSKYRNNGYASEALKRILEFLLIEVEYDRISAGHLADNPASGRVMAKAGMKYEGDNSWSIDRRDMKRQNNHILKDIAGYDKFTKIHPVNKGYSGEEKYYIETADGQRLLFRVSDADGYHGYERKKKLFTMMKNFAALNIPMCNPIDFGLCNGGKSAYLLLKWCEGEDAELLFPKLSEADQYNIGVKAGEILQKVHSIPATQSSEDWYSWYVNDKTGGLADFKKCGIQIDGSDTVIRYFEENKHLLKERPQSIRHGDFHLGNFILSDKLDLFVIDWGEYSQGDPWFEFTGINNADVFPYYTTGLIRGYFNGEPPAAFWSVFALYLAVGALTLVPYAFNAKADFLESCVQNAKNMILWFDNMKTTIPAIYMKGFQTEV